MAGHHLWIRFLKNVIICIIILLILLGVLAYWRTGVLDFSLFTGYRSDLLRGSVKENLCLHGGWYAELILPAYFFLFSGWISGFATSQLLRS